MANIKLIRRRMKSVQNIAQITRAMEMVAASKMKKAQDQALMGKPYAEKVYQAVRELTKNIERKFHPLLSPGNPDGKLAIVLISTNKGLCGGLNTDLFRMVVTDWPDSKGIDFITLGKKGEQFVARNGWNLVADFSENGTGLSHVPALTQLLVEGFARGTYKTICLVFNTFESALKQVPTKKVLLPLSEFETLVIKEKINYAEFIMEPGASEILTRLLPHYLENQIRSAILENEASEHSARMVAMKNATDAAVDFQHELLLLYNKARQEKITYEIADIVTARLAVE